MRFVVSTINYILTLLDNNNIACSAMKNLAFIPHAPLLFIYNVGLYANNHAEKNILFHFIG